MSKARNISVVVKGKKHIRSLKTMGTSIDSWPNQWLISGIPLGEISKAVVAETGIALCLQDMDSWFIFTYQYLWWHDII